MTAPKLLVFDLDGTLIDSSADLCRSVNSMLHEFGRAELPSATIAGYIGDGAAALVQRALAASPPQGAASPAGEFDRAYTFFIRYYREHKLDTTRLYEGVQFALQSIRRADPTVLMAVLTNKPVRPSREICHGLGIAEFFFQNYGGDSFATKKPDPEGLLALVHEANELRRKRDDGADLVPSDVVMIGDSAVDAQTARRGGVRSLGCMFGLAPQTLREAEPDLLVDHASEWPYVLGFGAQQTPASSSARESGRPRRC